MQGVVGDVATPEGRDEVVKAVSQAFGGQLGEGAGGTNFPSPSSHSLCSLTYNTNKLVCLPRRCTVQQVSERYVIGTLS